MEKEVFKTKKYEYRVDAERIEVLKKGKTLVNAKISDFQILYHRQATKRYGLLVFISPDNGCSISDQYGIEYNESINLLLEKLSSRCIMNLMSCWSALSYKNPVQSFCHDEAIYICKDTFRTKKYEYKINDDRIQVSKNGKFLVNAKISDFRVLYHGKISKTGGAFIFITLSMQRSIVDIYNGIEYCKDIDLLLKKISSQCIMDLMSLSKARCYINPSQRKRIPARITKNLVKKTETKCTCNVCSNIWYVSDAKSSMSSANAMLAIGNFLTGNRVMSAYHVNNVGNPYDCPKCGSSRIKKETVTFYTDKEGNYVDITK